MTVTLMVHRFLVAFSFELSAAKIKGYISSHKHLTSAAINLYKHIRFCAKLQIYKKQLAVARMNQFDGSFTVKEKMN